MKYDNEIISDRPMAGVAVRPIKRIPPDKAGGVQGVLANRPAAVASVDVTPPTVTLAALATQQLTATLRDNHGSLTTGAVVWSSSDATKATVGSNGLVTAVATGSATITGRVGEFSDTCEVTVS